MLMISHDWHLIEATVDELWAMEAALHPASAVQPKLYNEQLALTSILACTGLNLFKGGVLTVSHDQH